MRSVPTPGFPSLGHCIINIKSNRRQFWAAPGLCLSSSSRAEWLNQELQLLPETLRTLLEATSAGLVWTGTRFCRVEDGVRDVFSLVQIRATEAFFWESGWEAAVHGNQYPSQRGRHALKLSCRRWNRPLHRESPASGLFGEESQSSENLL